MEHELSDLIKWLDNEVGKNFDSWRHSGIEHNEFESNKQKMIDKFYVNACHKVNQDKENFKKKFFIPNGELSTNISILKLFPFDKY